VSRCSLSGRAAPASLLQDATQFIPPAIIARASRVTTRLAAGNAVTPLFNIVISNVPGSPTPLYSAGARLLANYPVSAIAHGIGLAITVLSYEDRVDFAIVTDRDQMPPWPLIEALRPELTALMGAAVTGPTRSAKRSRRPPRHAHPDHGAAVTRRASLLTAPRVWRRRRCPRASGCPGRTSRRTGRSR
jgi:hypothetical protein